MAPENKTMSEEKEIIEGEESEIEKTTSENKQKPSRKPIFIVLAVVGGIVLGALVIWLFRNRESGQPVPAPRTVSFDSNDNGQPSSTSEEQIITLQPEQIERLGLK